MMTLFKMDKRFFMLHAIAERLRTETWQYLALSGRYSGHYGNVRPTHRNQYVFYCSHLEKIRMKHIEEEYIRAAGDADDKKPMPAAPPQGQLTAGKSSLNLHNADTPPQEVPTPPDRAALTSPQPTEKNLLRRRSDSQSTLGDAADATIIEIGTPSNEKESEAKPTLQVHERDDRSSVRPARATRDSVLFAPPVVSGQPSDRV
jgi:hypothetical protein